MIQPLQRTVEKIPLGFRIIGTLKLLSAALLGLAGMGIFHLLNRDMQETIQHFVLKLHLAPGNILINETLAWAAGIDRAQLEAIGAGTFFFAALYLTEGIGIFLGCHWAEYLIVIATGSLVPLEIYEIARKVSLVKIAVLSINLLIVAYLVYQLRRERRNVP